MTCPECAHAMTSGRENVRWTASGLPGITLGDVVVSRCPKCGYHEVEIPNLDGLHRTIALALARKRSRLTPEEIRYLRTHLEWSGVQLAAHMGATPETVSRWEHGAAMSPQAERLLRLMIVASQGITDYQLHALTEIDETGTPRPIKLVLRSHRGTWRVEAT